MELLADYFINPAAGFTPFPDLPLRNYANQNSVYGRKWARARPVFLFAVYTVQYILALCGAYCRAIP